MRQPTDLNAAREWHRRAMAGENPPVHADDPYCGWFKRRMVQGGPWVPARIWIEQVLDPDTGELAEPELMRCEVNGVEEGAQHAWTWLARHPISEAEFDRMTRAIEHAGSFDPMSPLLTPARRVDLTRRAPRPRPRG